MTLPAMNPTAPSEALGFAINVVADTLLFSWNEPVVRPSGMQYRLVYAPTSLSDVSSKVEVWRGVATGKTIKFATNSPYYWQLQTLRGDDLLGPYTPNTFGTMAAAAISYPTVANSWGLSVTPNALSKSGTGAALTTGTAQCIVANSATPVFSWHFVNSFNGTVLSPSAQSTAFRANSMAVDESRTAQARCTVVDSGGASASVLVDLAFNRYEGSGGGGGPVP